jgi:enoyl-CoA hydratase
MSELQYLEVERHDGVALVRLNRPEVLNALCMGLMQELAQVFGELESDDGIAVIVMTGNDKAFAAGADITEMKDVSYQYMLESPISRSRSSRRLRATRWEEAVNWL